MRDGRKELLGILLGRLEDVVDEDGDGFCDVVGLLSCPDTAEPEGPPGLLLSLSRLPFT